MTVRYESEWVSDNRRNMHSTPDSIEAPRDYAPAILDILGALRSMLSLFVRGATVGLRWGDGQYPEDRTLKCNFLTTCLPWLFAEMRKPPLKIPSGHPNDVRLSASEALM